MFRADYHLKELSFGELDQPIVGMKRCMEYTDKVDYKGWCNTELTINEQTREGEIVSGKRLHAEMDEIEAFIAKLTKVVTEMGVAMAKVIEL